jgi:predicted phage terminase large subunit-like protein
MFNPEWWQLYEADELPPMDRIMLSVDCTFTKSATSDYVVGVVIGQSQNRYYVLDMDREKRDIGGTIRMMLRMNSRYRLNGTIIELAANGHAIYQTMHQRIPGLIGFKPAGNSKEGRAGGIVPIVEAGNVFLPKHAPWLDTFINEFSLFLAAKNDDIVDSVTQCINYMNTRTAPQVTAVEWGRSAFLSGRPSIIEQW